MKGDRIIFLGLALTLRIDAFVPASTKRNAAFCSHTTGKARVSPLYESVTEKDETKTKDTEEPLLSDLDARVLNSMLDNEKLDLETEASMKKLLERGVAPKTPDKPPTRQDLEIDGEYNSKLFNKLSSDGLWTSLKAKAGEVLETVAIFVANRVERDAKLLAAVGVFAWERAVRDVARALPESGTSGAAVGRAVRMASRQLTNTSSFDDNIAAEQEKQVKKLEDLNLYEELNTPMDEIRTVTQSILDILGGDDVATTTTPTRTRGLRTVAPAGQVSNAERQRRAYKRRKETVLKREKEGLDKKLGRTTAGLTDAAWEMKKELQAESNKPGYRTEGARKAIQAGAEQTAKTLKAAKEEPGGWTKILLGPLKEQKMKRMRAAAESTVVDVRGELLKERARVLSSVQECLAVPEETWLGPEVLNGCVSDEDGCPAEIDDDALCEVVTSMICLRDDLEATEINENTDTEAVLTELKRVKGTIESATSLAAVAAGYVAAESLSNTLYGREDSETQEPTMLRLDELETLYRPSPVTSQVPVVEPVDDIDEASVIGATVNGDSKSVWFAEPKVPDVRNGETMEHDLVAVYEVAEEDAQDAVIVPEIVDVDAATVAVNGESAMIDSTVKSKRDALLEFEGLSSAAVEVVSDEDFDELFGNAKSTSVVSEEEMELQADREKKNDNFIFKVTLRALDVVVFVAEKVFTVGIPGFFKAGKTASSRFAQVNRDGLGYKGWKKLGNVKDGKKKY